MDRHAEVDRALHARKPVSTDADFLFLTDDEVANGLAQFEGEEGAPAGDHETFESVPAQVRPVRKDRAVGWAVPAPAPEARNGSLLQAGLLAAMLGAAVVAFGIVSIRTMHTSDDGRAMVSSAPSAPAPGSVTTMRAPAPEVAAAPAAPAPVDPIDTLLPGGDSAASSAADAAVGPAVLTAREPEAAVERPDTPVRTVAAVPPPATIDTLRIAEAPIEPAAPLVANAAPLVTSVPPPPRAAVEPAPVTTVPPAPARAESIVAAARTPAPEAAIETVLSRYRAAYSDLDAGAARAVWPTADTKALRKAFERLEEQELVFDSCQVAVNDGRAVASCRGMVSYVPRVGSKSRRDDQRQWEFKLSRANDGWLIDSVSAR